MKTQHIAAALHNAATPAARLAAWQNHGTRRNLARIRTEQAKTWNAGQTPAAIRARLLGYQEPELSAPTCPRPLLWTGENSPEVLDFWEGREFLKHCGWYTADDTLLDWTLETCAVRLERFPHVIFYATRDNSSDGICVYLDERDAIDYDCAGSEYDARAAVEQHARIVIRCYDSTTERAAEESRECFEQDQREQAAQQAREERATLRGEIRDLIADIRALCPALTDTPAAMSALRGQLERMMRERTELMETINA